MQKNGSYRTVKHPQTVYIHPSSGLAQVFFLYMTEKKVVYFKFLLNSINGLKTVLVTLMFVFSFLKGTSTMGCVPRVGPNNKGVYASG